MVGGEIEDSREPQAHYVLELIEPRHQVIAHRAGTKGD